MLSNAILLDEELTKLEVPIISRYIDSNNPPTHHCWIKPVNRDQAFKLYLDLEKIGLLANYRLLPYDIGYGLRLGLSGATMSGLESVHIKELAQLIKEVYTNGYSNKLHEQSKHFIKIIKE